MAKTARDVTTGVVRLSYVNLFVPKAPKGSTEARYSCTILIPKSDTTTKQRIDAAIQAALAEGIGKVWGGTQPPKLNMPINDGDGVRPSDGMPYGPECKGHWVLNASSKLPPQVVDQNVQPIINPTDVYSGMYGIVSMSFFAYNNNSKGISCGLGNVQKYADGEPLGGRSTAAEDFTPITADASGYMPPSPGAYTAPQAPAAAPQQPAMGYPQQAAYPQGYTQPMQPQVAQQPPWQQAQPVQQPQGYPQQPAQPQQPQAAPQINPLTGLPIGQ